MWKTPDGINTNERTSILQNQNGYRIWGDSFKSKKYDSTFELNSSFLQIYACSGYA